MTTLENIRKNPEVQQLILGLQNQSYLKEKENFEFSHEETVAKRAGEILEKLNYSKEKVELAKIAGYLHDIGNSINRNNHQQSGAILAYQILKDIGIDAKQRTEIIMAIGNHEENSENFISEILAALVLADKSDIHRNRVVNTSLVNSDKNYKINYAVTNSNFTISKENRKVILDLTIDINIISILEYFELALERINMCKYAAKYLNIDLELIINDTKLL